MAYKTQIQVVHTVPFRIGGATKRRKLREVVNFIVAVGAGQMKAASAALVQDLNNPVAASGTVTLSGASGTVSAVINGATTGVAFSTSDAVTAGLLRDAINATITALVNQHVTATANLGVVTITAKLPGVTGNAITLAATGTGATASGARLTGGTDATGSSTNSFTLGS